MSANDDWDGLHSLDELLGSEENVHKWRPDLFDTVAPADRATPAVSGEVEVKPLQAKDQVEVAKVEDKSVLKSSTAPAPAPAPAPAAKPLCLIEAREYALKAHHGQQRRYTAEPYWKHLAAVAGLVASSSSVTPRGIALAWLHATVEETSLTLRDIERDFGASIADGVRCLTGSANSRIPRAARKQRYRNRLASADKDVHTVKLANIASNLASIGHFDPEFALDCYLEEKRLEVGVLVHGDEGLKVLVRRLWLEAKNKAAAHFKPVGAE